MEKLLVIAAFSFAIVLGFDNKDIFGQQGSELLKQLKESGVIDKFEEELLHMLKGEDPINTPFAGRNINNEVREFIDSYAEENDVQLDDDIIDHLASISKEDATSMAKHFVHLTQVIDKISGEMMDSQVLQAVMREHSIPSIKSSLEQLEANLMEQNEAEPALHQDFEIKLMIKEFIDVLKAKPDVLLDMVLPPLLENGLISESSAQMAKMYGQVLVKSESFAGFVKSLESGLDSFASSEGGRRLVELLPQILAADGVESMMDVVQKEVEHQWSNFFSWTENSDKLDQLFTSIAKSVLNMKAMIKELLEDDMKIAMANTLLITQGLPAIKPKKLTESLFKLGDHGIKAYTSWNFDLMQYHNELKNSIEAIEKEYMSLKDFEKLSSVEQTTLVARFFRETMMEPFNLLATAYRHTMSHPECAENMLCHLNAKMVKEGSVKSTMTKGMSLMATFAWTMDETLRMDRWKLYAAVWNGCAPETKCASLYTTKDKTCHVFPWQATSTMSLNFEHTEL